MVQYLSNHVQTCFLIANDDAISKFLFGSLKLLECHVSFLRMVQYLSNHVQTCLLIANDDAISKFLFGSLK